MQINEEQCDSMLIGDQCSANTFPYIDIKNQTASIGHEAATVKITEESLYNRDVYLDVDAEEDKWNQINSNLKKYKKEIEKVIGKEGSIHLHKTDKISVSNQSNDTV